MVPQNIFATAVCSVQCVCVCVCVCVRFAPQHRACTPCMSASEIVRQRSSVPEVGKTTVRGCAAAAWWACTLVVQFGFAHPPTLLPFLPRARLSPGHSMIALSVMYLIALPALLTLPPFPPFRDGSQACRMGGPWQFGAGTSLGGALYVFNQSFNGSPTRFWCPGTLPLTQH